MLIGLATIPSELGGVSVGAGSLKPIMRRRHPASAGD